MKVLRILPSYSPPAVSLILIVVSTVLLQFTSAQAPKHEFRSVWVATAAALDWPRSGTAESQRAHLREIIFRSKELGLNAVVFQVVARGDAMYPSERLPWAPWLTGLPAVDPGWDPLRYAIDVAHELGMELHAWYNVYRIGDTGTPKSSTIEPVHVYYANPQWVETVGNDLWLNPAYPELREWLVGNVLEIVENYDIDAIHFDFIRYNQGGYASDNQLFQQYNPHNIGSIADWRRENINIFNRDVYAAVKNIKPWVKVGSTPVGHYKLSGSWGFLSGYGAVFQDSRRWLQEGVNDYLAPQIYWAIGSSSDAPQFEWLVDDWMGETYDRHVYIGIAAYKPNVFAEMPVEIDTTRNAGAQGQVYFRYDNINTTSPFSNRYAHPALIPVMEWGNTEPPPAPTATRFDRLPGKGVAGIQWDTDGDSNELTAAKRFVMYRLPSAGFVPADLDDPANMYDITGSTGYIPKTNRGSGNFFVVTALDRNNNESNPGDAVEIHPPQTPNLASPLHEEINQRDTVLLQWEYAGNASMYAIEVSTDPAFTQEVVAQVSSHDDTVFVLTNIIGQETYYWRTGARNIAGVSEYSETFSFTTGFPAFTALSQPAHATTQLSPEQIEFHWIGNPDAEEYRFQLATGRTIVPENTVFDSTGITDTSLVIAGLEPRQTYYWRVNSSNQFGTGTWSEVWGFGTGDAVYVSDDPGVPGGFALHQNFPNPFNPGTSIRFSIPENSVATLRVFDILGREVDVLVHERLSAGEYTVRFNAGHLPSGTYIYQLRAGEYVETKRMSFVK